MSRRDINLAAKPFANERPVKRVSMLLWVVGGLLAALNVVLYWQAIFGLEDAKQQLVEVEAAIADERRLIADTEDALRAMDLRQQNAEAAFLNDRIEARTFPWSRLFDELARVLPKGVRLQSLRPAESEQELRLASASGRRIHLAATGTADSFESLLELLDGLFDDPSFDDPQLPRHSLQNDGNLRFQLSVLYFPDLTLQPAVEVERAAAGGPAAAGETLPPLAAAETGGAAAEAEEGSPTAMTSGGTPPSATELTPRVAGVVDPAADDAAPGAASPAGTPAVGVGAGVGTGAVGSGEGLGTATAVPSASAAPAEGPTPEPVVEPRDDRPATESTTGESSADPSSAEAMQQPLGFGRTASGPGGGR